VTELAKFFTLGLSLHDELYREVIEKHGYLLQCDSMELTLMDRCDTLRHVRGSKLRLM
jgi:hypothetical protein